MRASSSIKHRITMCNQPKMINPDAKFKFSFVVPSHFPQTYIYIYIYIYKRFELEIRKTVLNT